MTDFIYSSGIVGTGASSPNDVLLVDTTTLITLAQADLTSGSGTPNLNALFASGREIVLTSTVFSEATLNPGGAPYPDAARIIAWIAANPDSVRVDNSIPYPMAGSPVDLRGLGAGERSIELFAQSYGANLDVRVLSDDQLFIYGAGGATNRAAVSGTSGVGLTTAEYLNDLFVSGGISVINHTALVASVLATGRVSGDQLATLLKPGDEMVVSAANGESWTLKHYGIGAAMFNSDGSTRAIYSPFDTLDAPIIGSLRKMSDEATFGPDPLFPAVITEPGGTLIYHGIDVDTGLPVTTRFIPSSNDVSVQVGDGQTLLERETLHLNNGARELFRVDPTDTQLWNTQTTTTNAAGTVTDQTGTFDDGRTWDNDYDAAGRVDAHREFDAAHRLDTLDLYDDAGRRDATYLYDDAQRVDFVTLYDDANRVDYQQAIDDAGHLTQQWQYDDGQRLDYVWTYDTAGRVDYQQRFDDDGRLAQQWRYNDGQRVDTVWIYDDAGRLDYQQAFNDAGGLTQQWRYSDAQIVDVAWSFDAAGRVDTQQIFDASGRVDNVYYYDDSNRVDVRYDFNDANLAIRLVDYDQAAASTWATIEYRYDAIGRVTEQETRNDNATWSTQYLDVSGAGDWATYTIAYNSQNQIAAVNGVYDDGDRWASAYTNGQLQAVTFTDGGANDATWSSAVETYNAAGQLTTVDWWNEAGVRDERDMYDGAGRIDLVESYDAAGRRDEVARYDDSERVAEVSYFNDANIVTERDVYFYDAGGLVDRISAYDGSDRLLADFNYDDAGVMVDDDWYNPNGTQVPDAYEPDYQPDPYDYEPADFDPWFF